MVNSKVKQNAHKLHKLVKALLLNQPWSPAQGREASTLVNLIRSDLFDARLQNGKCYE